MNDMKNVKIGLLLKFVFLVFIIWGTFSAPTTACDEGENWNQICVADGGTGHAWCEGTGWELDPCSSAPSCHQYYNEGTGYWDCWGSACYPCVQ